jgi:hypothetical protein
MSPDAEAKFHCEGGFDKDGFAVKYISDFKGKYGEVNWFFIKFSPNVFFFNFNANLSLHFLIT